jgi:hypothetical protein
VPVGHAAAEAVFDTELLTDFLVDLHRVGRAAKGSMEVRHPIEKVFGDLGADRGFGSEFSDKLVAELEGGGSGFGLLEKVGHGFGGEAEDLVEELGAGVCGGEGFFAFVEFLGEAMDFGEFVTGLNAGVLGFVGSLDLKGEFVEEREAFVHVLMESGVVEEVLSGADGNFVIGVFRDEEAEGLLGVLDLAHGAIGVAHAVGGDGSFVRIGPVVDDGLKAVAQGGLGLF